MVERQVRFANGGLDDVLDVADRDAVAGGRLAIDRDVDVRRAGDLLGIHIRRAGTRRSTSATARGQLLERLRSSPKIFTPSSVRMPVESMSMRLMIGCVQMLATPGHGRGARPARRCSFSRVIPGRHWSRGFRCMMVSVMLTGAGSVEVSARPDLRHDRCPLREMP